MRVALTLGGWDMHNTRRDYNQLPTRAGGPAQRVSAVLADFSTPSLLEDTLVVLKKLLA